MDVPAGHEYIALGSLSLLLLFLTQPSWVGGFVFSWGLIFGGRLAFATLARHWPDLLALWALGRHLGLAGAAVGGILAGLNPVGVMLGLALWPVSLWIWTARRVRHRR